MKRRYHDSSLHMKTFSFFFFLELTFCFARLDDSLDFYVIRCFMWLCCFIRSVMEKKQNEWFYFICKSVKGRNNNQKGRNT